MKYTIDSKKGMNLKISPESTVEEILQNVYIILSTLESEAPLNRQFGLSGEYYGKPLAVAETLLFANITELLEEYEPRAAPSNITITEEATTGKISYILELEVNEDELS